MIQSVYKKSKEAIMKPEYVATKSAWKGVSWWGILFFWLVIPLIVMIVKIAAVKKERVEFYDKYIIVKWGLISKHERRSTFAGVISVSIDQSLFGRMLGYGTVRVDVPSKWDVNLDYTKNPEQLKAYLESKLINPEKVQTIMH